MKQGIYGGVFALLLIAGCVNRDAQKQAKETEAIVSDPAVSVAVKPASVETVSQTLEITGSVTTGSDAQVGAKSSGRLLAVYVKDGDPVAAGQVIAVQETSTQQAQLRQALAQLASAQASLSQTLKNVQVTPLKSAASVAQAEAQLRQANAQLRSAQASYAKAKSGARIEERRQAENNVASAKSNMETVQKDLNRTRSLVEQGALASARLDTALNAYNAALTQYQNALQTLEILRNGTRAEDLEVALQSQRQAEASVRSASEALLNAKANQKLDATTVDQVRASQEQVNSAQANVDLIRQNIADATIRSPFSGRVSGRPIQVGTVVGPGTPVARIIGGDGAYFDGEVPETAISKVLPGASVSIRMNAVPDRVFAGRVAAVNPVGSSVGRIFNVRIVFASSSDEVKPGMFATGLLSLKTVPNATVVPYSAVVKRDGKDVVYVLDGTTKVREVPVTLGIRNGGNVQVVGLPSGAQVVVRGQSLLSAVSTVKVDSGPQASGDATEEKGA